MAEENTSTENSSDDQYVVLARKYRPQNFDDLVGQDALVQTLTNAIKNNRLHHAYILTGIRGVGKTTTARIIAKALNCTGLCLLYTSPSPRDRSLSRMPSSA